MSGPGGGDGGVASSAPNRRRRPEPTPLQRAIGLLTRREHSRLELARKLAQRGVAREEADAAVSKLAEAGWQDDARFAGSLLRSRAGSGYGPLYIRAELGTHGLAGETIAAAMAGFDGCWVENARDLLRRRFGENAEQTPQQRRKAADLLVRRGFSMEQVRAAMSGESG